MHIALLDHHTRAIAAAIHRMQMRAYRQEAKLIGAADFPPLRVTVDDLMASNEAFYGALLDGQLRGVISSEEEGGRVRISSLVIAPDMQRQGIGIVLVRYVLGRCKGKDIWVTTAVLKTSNAISVAQRLPKVWNSNSTNGLKARPIPSPSRPVLPQAGG